MKDKLTKEQEKQIEDFVKSHKIQIGKEQIPFGPCVINLEHIEECVKKSYHRQYQRIMGEAKEQIEKLKVDYSNYKFCIKQFVEMLENGTTTIY